MLAGPDPLMVAVGPLPHPCSGGGRAFKTTALSNLIQSLQIPAGMLADRRPMGSSWLCLPSASLQASRPEEVGGVRRATGQTKLCPLFTQLSATCGRRLQTGARCSLCCFLDYLRGLLADCNAVEHSTVMISSDGLKVKTATTAAEVRGCTKATQPTTINTSIYRNASLHFSSGQNTNCGQS